MEPRDRSTSLTSPPKESPKAFSYNGKLFTNNPNNSDVTGSGSNSSNSAHTSPPNKSRMRRLSLTVSVSTQKYLEKMGKQTTTDTNDIKELKTLLKGLKKDLRGIKKLGRQITIDAQKETSGKQFGEMLLEFGEGALKSTEEGLAMRELGEQIVNFEENRMEEYTNGLGGMIEPMLNYYSTDLKKAREVKRKQNLVRIRYEQSSQNLMETKKKNDIYSMKTLNARKNEEDCKTVYNSTTKEFIEVMKSNKTKFQADLRSMIKEFADMQTQYYREAMENWEDFYDSLDSIIPDKEEEEEGDEDAGEETDHSDEKSK
ncbi:hypothetical protein PPL_07902 [Heterostelium album PN500]|uniref:BAR domain-containing protein n=1 Tax=Heterostelium pallidum (strain ATCC 26659 / Pp 5 / PN500) TaxID=670386 RepID=D3BHA0_HETP5|nr:hypothetical protein PPL_07902 [Heterostelium album PN500]EFA79077.1 hypothetical protein PPL_07902 [Heterostelium album PN500]|eukprot:XP_020431199.1 hypothetical protein PPL_07902 [Heterostelium album PN500]